jgi:hypothetical protein
MGKERTDDVLFPQIQDRFLQYVLRVSRKFSSKTVKFISILCLTHRFINQCPPFGTIVPRRDNMFWIWCGLILYALFLAPGKVFTTDPIVQNLLTGNFAEVDPLVVTVFNFLGLFPLLFASLLIPVERGKPPVWPFILGSFVLGAFSLLPYFFLRKRKTPSSKRNPKWIHKILKSNVYSILLILLAFSSSIYLLNGFSLIAYWEAFNNSKLVSVMTIDFLVLLWLSSYVMKTKYNVTRFPILSFIPVIGPLVLRWIKHNGRKTYHVYEDTKRTERHDD